MKLATGMFIAVITAFMMIIATPVWANDFTVIAENESVAGVEQDSGFIIRRDGGLSAADVADLVIMPPTDFRLVEISDTELMMEIIGELRPRTVYNIRIGGQSWAFQTKERFRIVATTPAQARLFIPTNTGIEFRFSQPVDAGELEGYISIYPPTEGRFSQITAHTVVFIPTEGLRHSTEYNVLVDPAAPALSGDLLDELFRLEFTTQHHADAFQSVHSFSHHGDKAETFTTLDPVTIRVSAHRDMENKMAQVRLYRFSDLDAYLSAISTHATYGAHLDTDELELVGEFEQQLLMDLDRFWHVAFLPMPDNPGEGLYLADIRTGDDLRAQKLIQVTDISVYSQTSNGQILFWLNDAATGGALEGALIEFGGMTAVTDADGVALLTFEQMSDEITPERRDTFFDDWHFMYFSGQSSGRRDARVVITHEERMFGEYVDFFEQQAPVPRDLYFSYVYTDREVYQPDDIVRFWGVVAPRHIDTSVPERITLDWTDGGRFPGGIEVDVNPDGTFTGEVELISQRSGWTQMRFTINNQFLASASFTVMDHTKPTHIASVSVDRPFYRRGEDIVATIEVGFFDGTPAVGALVSLHHRSGGWNEPQIRLEMVTDQSGVAVATLNAGYRESWRPTNGSFWGNVEDISIHRSYRVFPRDYILEAAIVREDAGLVLNVDTHAIDFDRAEDFFNTWRISELRGERADMTGYAELTRVTFERERIGEFYDFINRRVVNRYRFNRVETYVGTFPVETADGTVSIVLDEQLVITDDASYFVSLTLNAPDGTLFTEVVNSPGFIHWRHQDPTNHFHLQWHDHVELGEIVQFDLINAGALGVPEDARMLITVLAAGEHMLTKIVEGTSFELEFLPEYVPNVTIVGAVFIGRHIYAITNTGLRYDSEGSRLNIAVAADQERYAPGDSVVLDLTITDREGRGVPASFLMSVADEASFAVMDQHVNPLPTLFSSRWRPFSQFVSFIEPFSTNGYGEGGGGDGWDGIRREFLDTAAFITGQADADGRATVSFDLPHNLTSWRLTSLAFGDNFIGEVNVPFAGTGRDNVAATLPFFLNQITSPVYLSGDSIGVSLRAAGLSVSSDDVVMYTVRLSGDGVDDTRTARGRAFDQTTLYFDPLPPGIYTILMEARLGDYHDAIELEIEVVQSALLTNRRQSGDLADGITLDAERFPVRINLFDLDNALYNDVLFRLLHAHGERADQRIVRAVAGGILNELWDANIYQSRLLLAMNEHWTWNDLGVRLFPFTESDILLSAKAVAVAPDFFEEPSKTRLFRGVIADEESHPLDVAAAYMGLAGFGVPILPELREALDVPFYLSEEQLVYAKALAILGDTAPGLTWFDEVLGPHIVHNDDETSVSLGGDVHFDYWMTLNAAALAILTNHPYHQGFVRYLLNNPSRVHLPLLELALFATRHMPTEDSAAVFTYNIGGRTVTHNFGRGFATRLELGRDQLDGADFSVVSGNVGYVAHFQGGLTGETGFPDGMTVETAVIPQTDGPVRVGDIVHVQTTITFGDAPRGHYHIRQSLPTGLRFISAELVRIDGVEADNRFQRMRYPFFFTEGEAGMLNFYVGPRMGNMPRYVTFRYVARAVLPGQYIIEATALGLSGSDELYHGERALIEIER